MRMRKRKDEEEEHEEDFRPILKFDVFSELARNLPIR
jgi:hypothetical protein